MSTSSYITLGQDNRQQLAALEPVVSGLVSSALPSILDGGVQDIRFTAETLQYGAILRLGAGDPAYLQYSLDNGATWTDIVSSDYSWAGGVQHHVNDIVQHAGQWYTCVAATASGVPGASGNWRLIGAGTSVYNVYTTAQLLAALAMPGTTVEVVLHGVFVLPAESTATVQATTVVIRSDESCSLSGTLSLTATGKNVYWHCSGTRVTANLALNAAAGTLWLERLAVTGGTLTLSGDVRYQQIAGSHSGGTQATWTLPEQSGAYVPLDMSEMPAATYADAAYIYMDNGAGSGRLQLG